MAKFLTTPHVILTGLSSTLTPTIDAAAIALGEDVTGWSFTVEQTSAIIVIGGIPDISTLGSDGVVIGSACAVSGYAPGVAVIKMESDHTGSITNVVIIVQDTDSLNNGVTWT